MMEGSRLESAGREQEGGAGRRTNGVRRTPVLRSPGDLKVESRGDLGVVSRGRGRLWSSRGNVANDVLDR